MNGMAISRRLRGFYPDGFWLYVDSSAESRDVIRELKPFTEAGMLEIADLSQTGGFADGVRIPRLLINGESIAGERLREFIRFLKELNKEFTSEEAAQCGDEAH